VEGKDWTEVLIWLNILQSIVDLISYRSFVQHISSLEPAKN
jgi:hypothetical protein